jgi:hypothetical protein
LRTSSGRISDINFGHNHIPEHEIGDNTTPNQELTWDKTSIERGRPEITQNCADSSYKFGFLEVDAIQYVVVDEKFRDCILEKATEENWSTKKRHGLVRIRLPHITFQVGSRTITIYSDAPDKLAYIECWIRETFGKYYDGAIEGVVQKITHTNDIAKAELTINVTDKAAIATILNILGPFPEQNYHYIRSPNSLTPGFKAYFRGEILRCEFDGGGPVKPFNAIQLQDEFFSILPSIVSGPQEFVKFFKEYYNLPNPANDDPLSLTAIQLAQANSIEQITPIIKELISTEIKEQLSVVVEAMKKADEKGNPHLEESAFINVFYDISVLEIFEMEKIQFIFKKHLNLPVAATDTFIAAFHCWHKKKYRSSVLVEEILAVLACQEKNLTAQQIYNMRTQLITAGLFKQHETIEICFSSFGMDVAKKLAAKYFG